MQVVGQLVDVEWRSPHVILHLELEQTPESVQRWQVEIDSPQLLQSRGINRSAFNGLNVVAIILYPSMRQACTDDCHAYGLSLTEPRGNSYTLRRDISDWLTVLKRGN